jgi:hypothetical protein
MMRKLVMVSAMVAAGLAHTVQRSADEIRHSADVDTELLFLPSPTTFRLATMGLHEPVSDLLWVRAVLLFGERHGSDPDPRWGAWLAGMIEAIAALDPGWKTPYHYGGTMLRSIEAIDASNNIFELATEAFPDDAFFPFARGMNQYLYREDAPGAVEWLDLAADRPNAPPWYRVAAAGLLAKQDMRPVAIRFLEEQRLTTTDPTILEMIDGRLIRLRHDAWVDTFDDAMALYRERTGTDIGRAEDLERLGQLLPPDPFGEHWVLGADGKVRSSYREREEAQRARDAERALITRR